MLGAEFEAVLAAAGDGDPVAVEALWLDAHPPLLRYLQVVAGEQAEDIAAETWLKVIDTLGAFSGTEQGFRRWLVTIARNIHIDLVRRATRQPETLTADPALVPRQRTMTSPDAADLAAERSGTDRALRLVATLPPDQAELVMLRVVLGLDVRQVAEMTGRSAGAVRVGVHRALRRLAATLQAPEVEQAGLGTTPIGPHR